MGVNTDKIHSHRFRLGGFLAGVAGVFFGMKYTVYPQIGNITTNPLSPRFSEGWGPARRGAGFRASDRSKPWWPGPFMQFRI
jgi:hypothetical protein